MFQREKEDNEFYFLSGLICSLLVVGVWFLRYHPSFQPETQIVEQARTPASPQEFKRPVSRHLSHPLVQTPVNEAAVLETAQGSLEHGSDEAADVWTVKEMAKLESPALRSFDSSDREPAGVINESPANLGSEPTLGAQGYLAIGTTRTNENLAFITGGVSREELDGQLRLRMSQFQNCYDRASTVYPRLHGELVIRLKIGKQGKISEKTIASSDLSEAAKATGVGECVLGHLETIELSKPQGDVEPEFSFPVILSNAQAETVRSAL